MNSLPSVTTMFSGGAVIGYNCRELKFGVRGSWNALMIQYKAGYKYLEDGVHAQVLDFPAAITCGADLAQARRLLAGALLDVAETRLELGQSLPKPNPLASDPEMDLEEPVYLHLSVSTEIVETPAGEIAS